MKVGDVMSHGVRTVLPTDRVGVAIRFMLQGGYSGLPVVDDKSRLVGVITEGDLLRRAELGTERWHPRWLKFLLGPARLAREYTHANAQTVGDVMSTEPVSVVEDTPLEQAVGLMEQHQIKRLPVMREGRVTGMLSRSDLLRACLAALERDNDSAKTTDDIIRHRIEQSLLVQPWSPHATVQVNVRQGTAQLRGVVTSDALRDALRVLVENTPGVVAVDDQLTTVEPLTGYVVHPPKGVLL